ncbi:MAG: hypothetical protein RRB13_05170 [bacterium]|nr:hypothetical protein [bacterium]
MMATTSTITSRLVPLLIAAALFWGGLPQLAAQPLVTLLVPKNQRISDDSNWYGAFLELTLRANFERAGLRLSSFEVSALAPSGKEPGDFLLDGAFQQVGRLTYVKLRLLRAGVERLVLEETFTKSKTADTVTQMAAKLLAAIDAQAKWPEPEFYLAPEVGEAFYRARRLRYERSTPPSVAEAQALDRAFGASKADEVVVAEVATHLLLAAHGDPTKGGSLLKRADRLLRRALQEHPQSASLLSLLALDYQLSQSYPSFVEKTAQGALKLNPEDDLAALLLAHGAGLSSGLGKESISRFKQLNPWAFKQQGKRPYWAGALDKELAALPGAQTTH